jgi:hypothetical protein
VGRGKPLHDPESEIVARLSISIARIAEAHDEPATLCRGGVLHQ